jgi:hypothetical protein
MPIRNVRDGVVRSIGAALLLLAAATPAAADHGGNPLTFDGVVGQSRLIVVARISFGPDGSMILDVERVLKGVSPARLTYPSTAEAPPLEGWQRAVVAFHDPVTIDFRAPTIAWHVADDGTIDPEGFQQHPGLPRTLDAMVRAFGLDPTEGSPVADPPAQPSAGGDGGMALGIGVIGAVAALSGGAAILIVRRRRLGERAQ